MMMKKHAIVLTAVLAAFLLPLTACDRNLPETAAEPTLCRIEYGKSGTGGTLYGNCDQAVWSGENGTPVSVTADTGFIFAGWSDGETSPVHQLRDAQESTTIIAQFEQEHTDIPLICIETENGSEISSKETYLNCRITVSDPDNQKNGGSYAAQIRGRGNASWNFPKKGYKIKFSEKINLLSTGEAVCKDWTLISCYGDQSMLRNYAACRMGELLDGIAWSPCCTYAEVMLNGEYLGVYMISDQVEEQPGRVESGEFEEGVLDRDYLLELDMYAGGTQYVDFIAAGSKPYSIKTDGITEEQGKYLQDYMAAADKAVKSGKREEVEQYIDIPSLVDTYLLQEYSKNIDVGWSSLYIQKKAGGKLYYTAPWDFDLTFGNDVRLDGGSYKELYAATGRTGFSQSNYWFMELWKTDWFREEAVRRWGEIGDILDTVSEEVKALGQKLDPAMQRNYKKWDMLQSHTHQQTNEICACDTYAKHVEYLLDWMDDRRAELDRIFSESVH